MGIADIHISRFYISGYIEESVGRIEEATAAGQQTSNIGQGQTTIDQGEGHTLGSNTNNTAQEPNSAPSAEEMRERRLAFFNQPAKNSATDNSVNENGVLTPDDTGTSSGTTQSVASKTGKLTSK